MPKPNFKKEVEAPVGFELDNPLGESEGDISPGYGSSKTDFSKPAIVQIAVLDCLKKQGVEMRKGYTIIRYDKQGNPVQEDIPDTRKTFIRSVHALRSQLGAEIKADKDNIYSDREEELMKEIEDLMEKFGYQEWKTKPIRDSLGNVNQNAYIPKGAEKYIPEPGSTILMNINGKLVLQKGAWDMKSHEYLDCVVEVYDTLFEELNMLIARTGYFKKRTKVG